jgi:hypothetical protein
VINWAHPPFHLLGANRQLFADRHGQKLSQSTTPRMIAEHEAGLRESDGKLLKRL